MDGIIIIGWGVWDRILTYTFLVVLAVLMYRTMAKQQEQFLIARIGVTIPLIVGIIETVNLGFSPLVPPIAAIIGFCLAILWARPLIRVITSPLTNAFYPSTEIEDKPIYSSALRLKNQGLYLQALTEIDKELEKFPFDAQGHILKAQIWAKQRNEPQEAIAQLESFLESDPPPPQPAQILVYNQLAEVSLDYLKQPELASRYFKEIVIRYPETEAAQNAEQRIAQIFIPTATEARESKKSYQVEESNIDYGILYGREYIPDNMTNPVEDMPIDDLEAHLHEHPKNFSARRELILRLAFEEDRATEAMTWIQQTLEIPYQSLKERAAWFHLLADIQIKKLRNSDAAANSLRRLIEEDKGSAVAEIARKRIATLKREVESLKTPKTVQLQEYEQDIGLKFKRR